MLRARALDWRPDKNFRLGSVGAPAAAGEVRTGNRFPCLPPPGVQVASPTYTSSLRGVRVGVRPGCFAHRLGDVVCRGC